MTAAPDPYAYGASDLPAEATLVDLLDRLLAGGVTVVGDLVLSIADVPLVRVDLRALIAPADVADPPVLRAGPFTTSEVPPP